MAKLTYLLITANVGTLFNDETLTIQWNFLQELKNVIIKYSPSFFALHMQEVGGKDYVKYMKKVDGFIETLYSWSSQNSYSVGRAFVDDDYESKETFTALGSLYFVRDNLKNVKLYNFISKSYMPVTGFLLYKNKSLKVLGAVQKERLLSTDFGADFKSTRKGFMRTKWNIKNKDFDIVNVHLFHDPDNIIASNASPSVYAGYRRKALQYCLNKLHDNENAVPMFLFADFNFRLDTKLFVDNETKNSLRVDVKNNSEVEGVEYRDIASQEILIKLETKLFEAANDIDLRPKSLLRYNKEASSFPNLFEFEINFPPTYPLSEDINESVAYENTRIPAWTDRVLMNLAGRNLIETATYDTLGQEVPLGDHKIAVVNIALLAMMSLAVRA